MPTQFWVRRDALPQGKFITTDDMPPLADNQARIDIHQFAFTANNITYGVVGDRLGYWQFFPTNEDGWGIIPVWGFGTIAETNHPNLKIGERIFGFFPMASHAVLTVGRVSDRGITDAAAHRQELPAAYNTYVRADATEGYAKSLEAVNSLLRPAFITSFLLDDFFFDNDMFGASTIILTSASSKTAFGTAFLLNSFRENRSAYKIVGLTSPSNVDFVQSLGCYDEVLPYDDITNLDASQAAAYMDFSGSPTVNRTLDHHFQDNLTHHAEVGLTHWDQTGTHEDSKEELFFAPTQIEKRIKEWGGRGYHEHFNAAWMAFTNQAQNWIDVIHFTGQDNILNIYQDTITGKASPKKGYMLSLR